MPLNKKSKIRFVTTMIYFLGLLINIIYSLIFSDNKLIYWVIYVTLTVSYFIINSLFGKKTEIDIIHEYKNREFSKCACCDATLWNSDVYRKDYPNEYKLCCFCSHVITETFLEEYMVSGFIPFLNTTYSNYINKHLLFRVDVSEEK